MEKEFLLLYITLKGSKFYSYEKYKSDSILAIDIEKELAANSHIINLKANYKGKVNYLISKEYPTFKIYSQNQSGNNRYNVLDERAINWQIISDRQQIGDFISQKAEADVYGRKWTAWFSTDIPIQDGPYKFHGLPELIVKIEDQTKSYLSELKDITDYLVNEQSKLDDLFFNSKKEFQSTILYIKNSL